MKKRTFHITSLILAAACMAACNDSNYPTQDPETGSQPDGIIISATIEGRGVKTRTAVDVTDPWNSNPDFTKGEGFFWAEDDRACAIAWAGSPGTPTDYKKVSSIASTLTGTDGARRSKTADFSITAEQAAAAGLPDAGTLRMIYPAEEAGRVTLQLPAQGSEAPTATFVLPQTQQSTDFGKYDFMYADPLVYTRNSADGSIPATSFHHLGALLRFNVLNKTGRPYTLKQIDIAYSNPAVLKQQMIIDLTRVDELTPASDTPATDAITYGTDAHGSLIWTNPNYATDAPIKDDPTTVDRNEAVYDAFMISLPTGAQADGTFTVTLTAYDTDAKLDVPLTPLVLNCKDYAFLSTNGLKRGTRTYFCLDITYDDVLSLGSVTVAPWVDGGVLSGGEVMDIFGDPAFVEVLKASPHNVPLINGHIDPNDADTKIALEAITKLDVSGKGITSLQGIEYLTELDMLNCSMNYLNTLDVSRNTKLTSLECYSNLLTTLDVGKNIRLKMLNCQSNSLIALNLSDGNIGVAQLRCDDNRLTALDITPIFAPISSLDCGNQKSDNGTSGVITLTLRAKQKEAIEALGGCGTNVIFQLK